MTSPRSGVYSPGRREIVAVAAVARITERQRDRRTRLLRSRLESTFRPVRGGLYVVKPNLSSIRPSNTGATTDPEIVRAVVHHLQDHGAHARIVGLPPHARNAQRVTALTGYRDLAAELGIQLVVPDTHRAFVRAGRLFGVLPCRVARAAWEADGIVNVPKVKTHVQTQLSAAVKNVMGLADVKTRHRIHLFGLHRGLADLYKVVEPAIAVNVLDAVVAMEGQGPTRGDRVRLDTVFVGLDAVSCDLHACEALGIEPGDVPYLRILVPERRDDGPARRRLASLKPAQPGRSTFSNYLRNAVITQPTVREALQRTDFDFVTNKAPVVPPTGEPLDHLCPHRAIRGRTLLQERCARCHECIGPGSPVDPERGARYGLRVARELVSSRRS